MFCNSCRGTRTLLPMPARHSCLLLSQYTPLWRLLFVTGLSAAAALMLPLPSLAKLVMACSGGEVPG